MAERIRSVEVSIEIDTNKRTLKFARSLDEDDTIDEFAERIARLIREAVENIE